MLQVMFGQILPLEALLKNISCDYGHAQTELLLLVFSPQCDASISLEHHETGLFVARVFSLPKTTIPTHQPNFGPFATGAAHDLWWLDLLQCSKKANSALVHVLSCHMLRYFCLEFQPRWCCRVLPLSQNLCDKAQGF